MSVMPCVRVVCDGEDDGEECEADAGAWVEVKTARGIARTRGWRCDDTGDWCPDHMPEGPEVHRCQADVGSRPDWMSPGQYDPCRCRLDADHEGAHWCEHLDEPDPREHLRGER